MKTTFLKLPILLGLFFISSCSKDELYESILEETNTEVIQELEETTESTQSNNTDSESNQESNSTDDNIITPVIKKFELHKESYLNQKSGLSFIWSDNRSNELGYNPIMYNTSSKPVQWYGQGHAYHDVNGDGYQDILVSCHNTSGNKFFQWYVNKGNNLNFVSNESIIINSTDGFTAHKFLKTDVNNDGIADFIALGVDERIPNNYTGNFTVLIGTSDGKFTVNNIPNPNRYWFHNGAAGDINNDGNVDVITATFIWYGDGKGNFVKKENFILDVYTKSPLVYEIIDFNQDGQNDLILKGPWENTTIVLNKNGVFDETNQTIRIQPTPTFQAVMDIEIVDFDGDGDLDIIEMNQRGGNPPHSDDSYYFASKCIVYYNDNFNFTMDDSILGESLDGNYLHGQYDRFGWTVFKLDDIDNDGVYDFIAENYHDGEYNGLKKIDGIWKKYVFKFGK